MELWQNAYQALQEIKSIWTNPLLMEDIRQKITNIISYWKNLQTSKMDLLTILWNDFENNNNNVLAEQIYKKAIEKWEIEAYFHLSNLYKNQSKFDLAIQVLKIWFYLNLPVDLFEKMILLWIELWEMKIVKGYYYSYPEVKKLKPFAVYKWSIESLEELYDVIWYIDNSSNWESLKDLEELASNYIDNKVDSLKKDFEWGISLNADNIDDLDYNYRLNSLLGMYVFSLIALKNDKYLKDFFDILNQLTFWNELFKKVLYNFLANWPFVIEDDITFENIKFWTNIFKLLTDIFEVFWVWNYYDFLKICVIPYFDKVKKENINISEMENFNYLEDSLKDLEASWYFYRNLQPDLTIVYKSLLLKVEKSKWKIFRHKLQKLAYKWELKFNLEKNEDIICLFIAELYLAGKLQINSVGEFFEMFNFVDFSEFTVENYVFINDILVNVLWEKMPDFYGNSKMYNDIYWIYSLFRNLITDDENKNFNFLNEKIKKKYWEDCLEFFEKKLLNHLRESVSNPSEDEIIKYTLWVINLFKNEQNLALMYLEDSVLYWSLEWLLLLWDLFFWWEDYISALFFYEKWLNISFNESILEKIINTWILYDLEVARKYINMWLQNGFLIYNSILQYNIAIWNIVWAMEVYFQMKNKNIVWDFSKVELLLSDEKITCEMYSWDEIKIKLMKSCYLIDKYNRYSDVKDFLRTLSLIDTDEIQILLFYSIDKLISQWGVEYENDELKINSFLNFLMQEHLDYIYNMNILEKYELAEIIKTILKKMNCTQNIIDIWDQKIMKETTNFFVWNNSIN